MRAADASTARECHAGLGVWLGIQAALAAERGYQAEERILETRLAFIEGYGGSTDAAAAVTRDLGQSWDIVTDMAVKLVPGGHPYHALAEAAANAARDGNIDPATVESITVSRPAITALSGPLHSPDLIHIAHTPAYFLPPRAAARAFTPAPAPPPQIAPPLTHRP